MITIGEAKISEAEEIKKLLNYVWVDTYRDLFSDETIRFITEEGQSCHNLKLEIENSDLLFTVAKYNSERIVGLSTAEKKDDGIFLKRLYVHPDFQRQGIGISLLIHVLDNFKNAAAIYLEAEENNTKGINFYKKYDFEVIDTKQYNLKGDKFSTLLMKKLVSN
ncbi:MAG: GNAT family N-acetyltransferase [Bacillota bacterium]|nr:GNAT family N-acetyltransferase [Bacillota bacterium]